MEPKLDYINLGKDSFLQTTCQIRSALQVITQKEVPKRQLLNQHKKTITVISAQENYHC